MKFGNQLEKKELPKFKGQYLQYKELKQAVKVFTGQEPDTATVNEATHWTSSFLRLGPNPELPPEARLNEILKRELERVSKTAEQEQGNIRIELDSLLKDVESSGDVEALGRRLQDLGNDIIDLKSFSQVNFSGFRKILKKYDKWSKKSTMPWFMSQVVQAPLMTAADYDLLVQSLNIIATKLRTKGWQPGQQIAEPASNALVQCPTDAAQELVFLVDTKDDSMWLRVQLALSLGLRPQGQGKLPVGVAGKPQRPRITSIYFDNPGLDVYSANMVGEPAASAKGRLPEVELRTSEACEAVCVSYRADREAKPKEIMVEKKTVALLMKEGQSASSSSAVPGADQIAGLAPQASVSEARVALADVAQAAKQGMAAMAQATYLRSVFTDRQGIPALLDEDIRISRVKEWDGAGADSVEYFPYSTLTIVYPQGYDSSQAPGWLRSIFDSGRLLQVSGFSKSAHCIAHFYSHRAGLPAPQWYQSVLSSGRLIEENEPEVDAGSVKSGSASGSADVEHERSEKAPKSHSWTETSARLLHEFGTTPEAEEELALTRTAVARKFSAEYASDTVPAPDGGGLNAPLLASGSDESAARGSSSMWARAFGEERDKPVRQAIVSVQPKTLFSNERTFLEWIHFSVIIASAGVFMLHATGQTAHVMIGRVLILAAIFLTLWSMRVFNWRADGLDFKVDRRYEDNVGPVVLIVSLLGALLFSSLHAVGVIH